MLRRIAILTIMLCLVLTAKGQDDAEDDDSNPVVDSLLRKYAAATSDTARMRLCMDIGLKCDYPDTVIKYSNIGIPLYDGSNPRILARLYSNLGWAYSFQERHEDAVASYNKAIDLSKEIGDAEYFVTSLVNLSHCYLESNNYHEMWLSIYEALRAAQQYRDTGNICYCYYSIAVFYSELNMKQQGIEAAEKGFAVAEQAQDKEEMGSMAGIMCNLFSEEADAKSCRESIEWGRRSVEYLSAVDGDVFYIAMRKDAYRGLAKSFLYLAGIEDNSAFADSACHYIAEIDRLRSVLVEDDAWIDNQINKALVRYVRRDYNGALKIYLETLNFVKDVELEAFNLYIYEGLSKTYDKLGDYRNAFKYYELYRAEKDKKTGTRAMVETAAFEVKSQVELEQEEADYEKRNAERELEEKRSHFVRMMIVSAAGFVALLVFLVMLWRMLQETRKGNAALLSHNEEIKTQNEELNIEKAKIEGINDKIRQSMRYARRIQVATVSSDVEIVDAFPNAMVYYKPCEIVSGDWYWASRLGSKRILALGGSAKHGVPGALVSMMTVNALKDTVGQLSAMSVVSPTAILRTVQSKLPEAARNNAAGLSLCVFGRGSVRFAGVNQNAMLIKNGNPIIMRGDKPGDLFNTVTESDVVMLYSASTKRELLDRDIKPEALCSYLSQQSPVGQKGAIEELVSQRAQKEDITVVSIII